MAESTATVPRSLPSLPPVSSAAAPLSPASTPTGGIPALVTASQFLKPSSPRKRRRSPDPGVTDLSAARRKSLSPVSPKTASLPASAISLTGEAEMAEKKRRLDSERGKPQQMSENPQTKALGALMGLQAGMSKPDDAPSLATAANAISAPVAAIAPAISIPDKNQGTGSQQISPASTKSVSTMDSAGAATITAGGQQVSSPRAMVEEEEQRAQNGGQKRIANMANGEGLSKSMTYPGPLGHNQMADGRRNMSLPGSGLMRDDSKSPSSNKKHKCPYCSTEFTRHHNLKSHLLTHSHEKPYQCKTCDSRFRRLHDLKRHTKLHTGERPHVCPKCNRSFARGDALARHNKGQGGCAGRRSSVGSFGGDQGDESMEGMIYTTGDASQEPDAMDDEVEGNERLQLPSIRRPDPPVAHLQPDSQSSYQRQPSTYPPVAAARAMNPGSLYPPTSQRPPSGGPTSPSSASPHMNFPSTGPSPYPSNPGYGQPMTESPKPLSPSNPHPLSAGDPRNRSPSLSSQLPGQPYPRRASSRATPPPTLPPPHSSVSTLPPPHGIHPHTDPRFAQVGSPSGPLPAGIPLQSQPPGSFPGPPSVGSNSLSSHGTGAPNSGDRSGLPFGNEDRLWALVKALESRVEKLEAELSAQRAQQQPSSSVTSATQGTAR